MAPNDTEIHADVLSTIGNTPLVRLNHVTRGLQATVLAKLEFLNPGGSVKDRIGIEMIQAAEREGKLRPGGTIVEATSGNTGAGLAIAAAVKGYRCIFVMPDKMSEEKVRLLRAYGARVIVTPTAVEPDDPRSLLFRLPAPGRRDAQLDPGRDNIGTPRIPRRTIKPQDRKIWRQTGGAIDYLVCGMGTGGTITGTGKFLKEQNPEFQVVGVDPVGSLLYDTFKAGGKIPAGAFPKVYKIEGIGEDFLPTTLDFQYIDDVVQVGDRESFLMARRLVREEGLFCGGSSGTAVVAALQIARSLPAGKNGRRHPPGFGLALSEQDLSRRLDARESVSSSIGSARGTCDDILRQKRFQIVLARAADTKNDVIARMKQYDISQLPVIGDAGGYAGHGDRVGPAEPFPPGGGTRPRRDHRRHHQPGCRLGGRTRNASSDRSRRFLQRAK